MFFKEIGKIYEATDYAPFKSLQGNRYVSDPHVNKIIKSFKKVGRRNQPITVNRKMEIIDGQGRFEACKRLGLPIHFVFDEDAGIDECIAMNINQTNWKLVDYIRSFAEQGKPAYQNIISLMKTFSKIPIQVILAVCRGSATDIKDENLREGIFEFKVSYDEVKKELKIINSFLDIPISGRIDVFCLALHFLYSRLNFNMNALLQKLQANYQKLAPFSDIPECLQTMSDVWNFRTSKNRVYWQTEYDKSVTQKSRWKNKN